MTAEQKAVVKTSLAHLALMWFIAFLITGPILYVQGRQMDWGAFFIYTTMGAIAGELILRRFR